MLLILDLDETLLYATERQLERAADHRFERYHLYLRPQAREFVAFCREHFTVAVWTSSSEDYAASVVSFLFGDDYPLEFVWGRKRCTLRFDSDMMDYEWLKNLSKVKRRGYPLEQVLMVDDTPRKLKKNYGNLVRIPMFEGDAADQELGLLMRYLLDLKHETNVRKVEKRGWRTRYLD